MISHTTDRFWKVFALLPERVQQQAEKAYAQWKADSYSHGLHFKCIHQTKSVYSIRIGIGYRALGRRHGDEMIWFWIGTHEAYNELIKRL
jgi:hypothetical protein